MPSQNIIMISIRGTNPLHYNCFLLLCKSSLSLTFVTPAVPPSLLCNTACKYILYTACSWTTALTSAVLAIGSVVHTYCGCMYVCR